ncbi:MAG: TetR/AcrR family transcriptional regulator [Kangiellaceae bacterium]|nr:TetR/AcrR family transcriptional regulator [Kangiellaceae bacterium]
MGNTDARTARSRKALMDAGIELLLQNPAASLKEIAEHAGVGRATLYRQFESREQLVQALAVECFELKEQKLAPLKDLNLSARETLEQTFMLLMPMADRFHFLLSLWNIAEQDPEVMALYNRQLFDLVALVEKGKKEGSIDSSFDSNWLVCLIDSLMFSGWWMMGNMHMTPDVAAKHAIKSLFSGVG